MLRTILVILATLFVSLPAAAEEPPTFADYQFGVLPLKTLADPVIFRGSWVEEYRTQIEACAAQNSINFGSHFTSCSIGRGPDTQTVFVIDRISGMVNALLETRAGHETEAGSLLLVANTDHDSILQYVDADDIPESFAKHYYFFDERNHLLESLAE